MSHLQAVPGLYGWSEERNPACLLVAPQFLNAMGLSLLSPTLNLAKL